MKVFVAVLALVAAASAGVVVDHAVEKTVVQPGMVAGERAGVPVQSSAQAAEDALKKAGIGATGRLISFYSEYRVNVVSNVVRWVQWTRLASGSPTVGRLVGRQ